MCTLTIVPIDDERLRLVFNRDELISRPPALPPLTADFGSRRGVLPLDPQGGGSWIAASDAGLAFALLNLNRHPSRGRPAPRESGTSRGLLIPDLLGSSSIDEALERARAPRFHGLRDYRLVVTDRKEIAVITSGEGGGTLDRWKASRIPRIFSSSGLGDHLVEVPRRELFERTVVGKSDPVASQDRFHRHRWPSRPHLSVCMDRGEARTVSRTVLMMGRYASWMRYRQLWPRSSVFPRVRIPVEGRP